MPTKAKTREHKYGSAVADELIGGMKSLLGDLQAGKLNGRSVQIAVEIPELAPADVRGVRESLGLSQPLFANFIGASASAVRAWEQGAKTPTPMACRFLDSIRRDPAYWRSQLTAVVEPAASPATVKKPGKTVFKPTGATMSAKKRKPVHG